MIRTLYLFLFFCFFTSVYAQDLPVGIEFPIPEVIAEHSGSVSSKVVIRNNSSLNWSGVVLIQSNTPALQLSTNPAKKIQLSPGQQLFIPIIACVTQGANQQENITLTAAVVGQNNQTLQTASQRVLIEKNRRILLINPNRYLQFQQVGDSINIRTIVKNKGNTKEEVHLVYSLPFEFNKHKTITKQLSIAPAKDTILNLYIPINKQAVKLEDFDINTTLLYANGDFIARTTYLASSLKARRKYKSPDLQMDYSFTGNAIEINRVIGNNVMKATELIGGTDIYFNQTNRLGLSTNIIYWEEYKKANLRQVLLDYQTDKLYVKAGNIYQMGELSIQGRGIQSNYKISDSITLSAGYIDKTYLVTDPTDRSIGYSTWVGFNSKHHWKQSEITYDLNHQLSEKKILWHNAFDLYQTANFNLSFNQGLSLINTRENNHLGILLGVNSFAMWKDYQFQTNSFWSSPYYGGMRQGTTQINTNIRKNINKHSFGLTQTFIRFAPRHSYTNFLTNKQQALSIGLNYALRLNENSFSISPKFVQEERFNYKTLAVERLNALRLTTTYSKHNFFKDLSYSLTSDLGTYTSISELSKKLHYRLSASLNYKAFSLGTSYQYNYSNLSELINSWYIQHLNATTYTNFMVMGKLKQELFNNKVRLLIDAFYTSTSTTNDLWQINSRIEYQLTKDFQAYVNNYNSYGGFTTNAKTNYLQIGLIKQLEPYRPYIKTYNLKIQLYYLDEDKRITIAANRIIYINGRAFISNAQGIVEYRKLPTDSYTIEVKNDKHWFANAETVLLNQDAIQEIYLKQTTTLSGKISYSYNDRSYLINKKHGGQKVVATSQTGQTYTAYTSDQGEYIFYIPKGKYSVMLYPENSQYLEIEDNGSSINTYINQPVEKDFVLIIKDRTVETKKFKAISF